MFDALMKARGETPDTKDEPNRIVKKSADDRLRYYEFKGGNHNSAWDKGLTEPDLCDWFFSKSLSSGPAAKAKSAPAPAKKVP
jgi:hypothetical protein